MAPNKPAKARIPPKSTKAGQSGTVLGSLKSSIQLTKNKLHTLRRSATGKITKITAKSKQATEPERLKRVIERLSAIEDSSSSGLTSTKPTPDTSPQSIPDTTPHIPPQGPSTLTPCDFEVGGSLEKGKFGRVYLARHIDTNYICVLKIMSKAQCSNEEEERRVRREIEVHQNFAHKNILKLLSWFHDSASIYFVLEYAPGGRLYSRLKKQPHGRFDERTAAQYVAQMAEALRYMHSKDIIHWDIKPENILFELHQEIKLADFGYSVHSESGFQSTVCGTLDYLSPEVAVRMLKPGESQEYYAKAIDQWSLGILMYEMLVGRAPFEMKDMAETQTKIARYKGKEIKLPGYVSREAQELIRALLNLEAEKRMGFEEVLMHGWIVGHVEKSVKSG